MPASNLRLLLVITFYPLALARAAQKAPTCVPHAGKEYCCPCDMVVESSADGEPFCHSATGAECALWGKTRKRDLCKGIQQCDTHDGEEYCCPPGMRSAKTGRGSSIHCHSKKAGECQLKGSSERPLCPTAKQQCVITRGGKEYCCPIGMRATETGEFENDIYCHSKAAGKCQLKGRARELCPTVPQCTRLGGEEYCCPAGMRTLIDYATNGVSCHSKAMGECQLFGGDRELCPSVVQQCVMLNGRLGSTNHCCPVGMQSVMDGEDAAYCKSKADGECQLRGKSARELCPTAQECATTGGVKYCCPAGMRNSRSQHGDEIYCHSAAAGECQLRGHNGRETCPKTLPFHINKTHPKGKYELTNAGDLFHFDHGRKCQVAKSVHSIKFAPRPNSRSSLYYVAAKGESYALYELDNSQLTPSGNCPEVKKRVLDDDFTRFHLPCSIEEFLVEKANVPFRNDEL